MTKLKKNLINEEQACCIISIRSNMINSKCVISLAHLRTFKNKSYWHKRKFSKMTQLGKSALTFHSLRQIFLQKGLPLSAWINSSQFCHGLEINRVSGSSTSRFRSVLFCHRIYRFKNYTGLYPVIEPFLVRSGKSCRFRFNSRAGLYFPGVLSCIFQDQ